MKKYFISYQNSKGEISNVVLSHASITTSKDIQEISKDLGEVRILALVELEEKPNWVRFFISYLDRYGHTGNEVFAGRPLQSMDDIKHIEDALGGAIIIFFAKIATLNGIDDDEYIGSVRGHRVTTR